MAYDRDLQAGRQAYLAMGIALIGLAAAVVILNRHLWAVSLPNLAWVMICHFSRRRIVDEQKLRDECRVLRSMMERYAIEIPRMGPRSSCGNRSNCMPAEIDSVLSMLPGYISHLRDNFISELAGHADAYTGETLGTLAALRTNLAKLESAAYRLQHYSPEAFEAFVRALEKS